MLGWSTLFSQLSYLDRPGLLEKVNTGLNHTYNFAFEDARKIQQELLRATPDHPAPVFLEALILYWEHFPLLPEDQASDRFVQLMEQCVHMAETLIEREETYLEGVFFDLFGRAFQAMFWADNGKSGKLVPDLRTMYKRTKEGFGLKEDFVEFYFRPVCITITLKPTPKPTRFTNPCCLSCRRETKSWDCSNSTMPSTMPYT